MVYREKFVAVLKVNGKILREFNDLVELPFGTEYSILLKNLNNQRAVVDITIDGEDVLDGNQLVVNANSTMELDGFMRGNNTTHKFKFIEKTQEISDFRGDDVEDGIIRIEYRFEKPYLWWLYNHYQSNQVIGSGPGEIKYGSRSSGDHLPPATWTSNNSEEVKGCHTEQVMFTSNASINCSLQNSVCDVSCNENEEGITVRGSESDQNFRDVHMGELESTNHVICLKLKGYTGNRKVRRTITVKTKRQCDTCGRRWKSSRRFCGNCGTALFN